MKLQLFNETTTPSISRGIPRIRLSAKQASSLNARLVFETGLKAGDKISLAYDKEQREWYMIFDPDFGITLRQGGGTKNPTKSLQFNNSRLVDQVFRALKITGESAAFRVVTEPVQIEGMKAWCIIIHDRT